MRSSLARWALSFVCLAVLVPAVASARVSDATTGLSATGRAAQLSTACSGGATQCITTIVGRALNVLFGFIGVVLLGYVIYGGFSWMTASDPKGVTQAQGVIRNAVIGVTIIACSFAISSFVLDQLGQISRVGSGAADGSGASGDSLSGSLDGASRLCCYEYTKSLQCKDDCLRTPTNFGLTTGATSIQCSTACNSRMCAPSGPVPGQAICEPGSSAPTAPGFSLAEYCTALGREPVPTATCDACVRDCAVRSLCTPSDPIYRGGTIRSTADATAQRAHCRETVCTLPTATGGAGACSR